MQQVNQELDEVEARLNAAEKELEVAKTNYDTTLNDLSDVQQSIVQEQTKLGKIKSEISNVKDELFQTQQDLIVADESLQEQAVNLYMNGVMSPTTVLFADLDNVSSFLIAVGYASTVVDSAYEIIEQLNALQNLASSQTVFLTEREKEREETVSFLQSEETRKTEISIEAEQFAKEVEEKKEKVEREKLQVEAKKLKFLKQDKMHKSLNQANQELEKLDKEHADLEKLEDAIQADIDRLSSLGGVAPNKLSWPVTTGYVSSGYKWRRLGAQLAFMVL